MRSFRVTMRSVDITRQYWLVSTPITMTQVTRGVSE